MADDKPRKAGEKARPKRAASKKKSASKTTKKKTVAKKSTTRKVTKKKTAAKKTAARKVTKKKASSKKASSKKVSSKKTTSKKVSSKKVSSKKTTSKRAATKKVSTKKAPAKKAAPKKAKSAETAPAEIGRERLHKFLASTGAGSRRECETFIAQGRVSVNGQTIVKMGVTVDPTADRVLLDGELVKPEARVYYLLNKPGGYICTNADERGRPRAVDLIKEERRIYTVGRLDADSTGLVLLTNDGGIANIVCHPRYRIEKCYRVHVRGDVDRSQIAKVEAGVWLAEGRSSPARVKPIGRNPKRGETVLEMTLFEGRNREIRRVFAKVGLTVRRLQRTSIGPLDLGEIKPGAYVRLDLRDLAFVGEAVRMYEANQEAWDAELPPEEKRRGKRRRRPLGQGPVGGPKRDAGRGGRGPADRSKGWAGASFPTRGRRSPEQGRGPGGSSHPSRGTQNRPYEKRRPRRAD